MNQRRFGRTGLFVSELCLGAGRLSWLPSKSDSFAILDSYFESGGNFIQTSSHSVPKRHGCNLGRSEELIGAWWKTRPSIRSKLVVSTRIHCPERLAGLQLETVIRRQLEDSLRRLGTEYVDLLLLDWSLAALPADAIFSVVDRLVDAGMMRFAGAVGFPYWRVAEWLGRSAARSSSRFESMHIDGSLSGSCLSDLVREHRIALVVRWPFTDGYEPLDAIAREMGISSLQAALSWLLSREEVTSIVLAARAAWQVFEGSKATKLKLSADALARLDSAFLAFSVPPATHSLVH